MNEKVRTVWQLWDDRIVELAGLYDALLQLLRSQGGLEAKN